MDVERFEPSADRGRERRERDRVFLHREIGIDAETVLRRPRRRSRIAALTAMSVKELKAEWERLLGSAEQQPRLSQPRIAYRLQKLTYGSPDHETRRMLDLLADEVEGVFRRKNQIADPRNPVAGTRLIPEWNGVEHTTTVLKDGFEWQGRKCKSLSGIAREITGVR